MRTALREQDVRPMQHEAFESKTAPRMGIVNPSVGKAGVVFGDLLNELLIGGRHMIQPIIGARLMSQLGIQRDKNLTPIDELSILVYVTMTKLSSLRFRPIADLGLFVFKRFFEQVNAHNIMVIFAQMP